MPTPTPPTVTEQLMAMAAKRSGLDVSSIDPQAALGELGIDSLGLAELMFDIDDAFGIEITDEHMASLHSVSDLIALIERLMAERTPA